MAEVWGNAHIYKGQPGRIQSLEHSVDIPTKWSINKHFAVHNDRRNKPPLSLEEIHVMAKERAELYNTSCYIQPDDDDNQLILTRKRPYDGEIGFATATLTCRLGIWKCIIRAGNNVIDIFDGKFHLDVYTNMCVVLEVIGERNKWKCCHGYSHSQDQKIEFAYECLGGIQRKRGHKQ